MRQNPKYRTVITFQSYFEDFLNKQSLKVKEKILWTIGLIEDLETIPSKFLKSITNAEGLYEIRVQVGNNIYRIFCFYDEDKLVLLLNGFQKKTQKTPNSEIKKALKIKEEYEKSKK